MGTYVMVSNELILFAVTARFASSTLSGKLAVIKVNILTTKVVARQKIEQFCKAYDNGSGFTSLCLIYFRVYRTHYNFTATDKSNRSKTQAR